MRVATWLPRALRDELAGLDPAPATVPARPRPDIDEVIARAAHLDDNTTDGPGHFRGATDPVVREPGARPPTGRFRLLAIACSALLVAGLAIGLTFATRSHHTQPGASGAIHRPTRSGTSGTASLYGVTWLDTAAHATVVFAPGTAHWSDGCAGETRTLSVTSHHLHLGALQPGAYGCGGTPVPQPGSAGYAAYQREQHALGRFFGVLDSTPAWSITGHQLTLTSPAGRTLTLTSQGTAPLTLPGSRWTLLIVIPVNPRIGENGFRGPTLAFDHHGRFRATDGSGDVLTGTATIDNDHVTLTRDPSTYRGPRKPALSTAIDTMLSGQLDYQIENNTLRLTKPNTDGMLIYAPASG